MSNASPCTSEIVTADYYRDEIGHYYCQYLDGLVVHLFLGELDGLPMAALNSISPVTLYQIKIKKGYQMVRIQREDFEAVRTRVQQFLRTEV